MSSFRRRPARRDDAEAVVELVTAIDVALLGSTNYSLGELSREWEELDVEHDAWVVEEGERVVGYGTVALTGELGRADGYVHPDVWGRGVGESLVRELEDELGRRGAGRVHNATLLGDDRAQDLLRGCGYAEVRRFSQMRITLDGEPAPRVWPAGVEVIPYADADLARFHAALESAFADRWNDEPETLEEFRHRFVDRPDFTPELWTVGVADGEIVAGTVCRPDRFGVGWVSRLSTSRPWRGRGIGAALLAVAFGRFWARGTPTIGLGVDAASGTGAQRLYERAGMHVDSSSVVFEKHIVSEQQPRPGERR